MTPPDWLSRQGIFTAHSGAGKILRYVTRLADRYGVGLFVYLGVALVSALSEWTSFIASLSFTGPIIAALIGFGVGTVVNFLLSKRFVFRSVRTTRQEFILLMSASIFAFGINLMIFILLFKYAGMNVILAKIIGTCSGFVFNFGARQFYVFSSDSRFAPISALLERDAKSNPRKRGGAR